MTRLLIVLISLLPYLITGCGLRNPPPEHTHASLRNYFGDSPSQLVALWGKPASIMNVDSHLPPDDATSEELERFKQSTEREQYVYPTRNGELVFHFNHNDEVYAITYEGKSVPPPPPPPKGK